MGLATLATANAILKEDYLGPLRTALNTATPVLSRLNKNTRDIVGLEAWIPIEMALSQAAGARGEDEVLPTASKGEYKELKVSLKHYYGAMQVSGPVMRQTGKGERGSFGRIIDIEAKGMKRLLSLVLAHDFYLGDRLATCGVTAAASDVVLATDANMEYFFKGMVVDIVITATGVPIANGNSVSITAVDKPNKEITVDGGVVTTSAIHSVVREDTWGKTVTPLDSIIDDTIDIYGVTTASFDEWKSTVNAALGVFTVPLLQAEIDKVVIASGKMPTALFSDYARQTKYFSTLTANPRYVETKPPDVMDGGFRRLQYSGGGSPMDWVADRLCPAGTIYVVHEPDIKVFTPADFEFIEIGGDVWLPDIMGSSPKDNYKAVLYRDMELGAYNRNSHAKLEGVTDS